MKSRFLTWIAPLSMTLAAPVRTTAQPRASEGATSSSWGGAVSIMVVMLIVILAIAGAAKLYDHKRKREEEAFAAQAYLADAFLREFGTLPVVASVSGSLWSRSPLVLAVRGTVPTPEVREAIMRLARQELSRQYPFARAEDQLFVDPLSAKQRAGRLAS